MELTGHEGHLVRMLDCAVERGVFNLKAPTLIAHVMAKAMDAVADCSIVRKVPEREHHPPLTRMDVYTHPVLRYR